MGRRALLIALLAHGAALTGGCAGPKAAELGKLRQRLDELAQNDSASQRRIEELNNRLFLLEDKVDTERVASGRVKREARLPVVRIRPEGSDADPAPATAAATREPERAEPVKVVKRRPGRQTTVIRHPPDDGDGATRAPEEPVAARRSSPGDGRASLVDAHDVTYGGKATSAGPRPVLRLHGAGNRLVASPSPKKAGSKAKATAPAAFGSHERLPVVPMPSRSSVSAAKMYSKAMKKYRAGSYSSAAEAFRGFIGRYGKHAYADNAIYWLGECFYDMKKYRMALKMFRRVVEQHPNGNKAPDALLKMGYCYMRLEERANARSVLAQVVEIFPKSNSARLASSALTRLQ